jgi:biopolymer transport protein TolQ
MLMQTAIQEEIQNRIGLTVLFQNLSPVSWVVLIILALLSVWSWGIILSKTLLLRKVAAESETFWRVFRQGHNLSEIAAASQSLRFTPLTPVLRSGTEILQPRPVKGQGGAVAVSAPVNVKTLERTMQRAAVAQLTALESRLTFLATTASVAPFVGLFGTVWGVLTSFLGLSNADSATLKAVGPGIAEALIATAFGLAAAIPAVIAYNHFVNRLRNVGGQLDDLQADLLAIAEENE